MDADDVLRLIAARCPELSDAELSLTSAALKGDVVSASALEDVLTVLDALEARLDGLMGGAGWPHAPDEGEDADGP